ncbi:unnamed protein product, partial [Linum tenue]
FFSCSSFFSPTIDEEIAASHFKFGDAPNPSTLKLLLPSVFFFSASKSMMLHIVKEGTDLVTSFIMVVVGGNRHQFRERRVRRQ